LEHFEWEDSHPLENVDGAFAIQGRFGLVEAITGAYLVDGILPAFTLDVILMEPSSIHDSGSMTAEARLVGREYTVTGEVCAYTTKSVSHIELFNELTSYVEPCLPHHFEFYPSFEIAPQTEQQQRTDEMDFTSDSRALHAEGCTVGADLRQSSRHMLNRSDFSAFTGQLPPDRPTHPAPLPSLKSSQMLCSICSQNLPSRGIQCHPCNCTCSRSDRPLCLKIRFIAERICCLGFVCCTATLPRFDGADLLPLFKELYPITPPWLPFTSPRTAANPSQPDLVPPAPCLCGVHGLWTGAYGPHGLEIVCLLQVNIASATYSIPGIFA
jgi:hypothetical protein